MPTLAADHIKTTEPHAELAVDENGFLLHPETWDMEIARLLATRDLIDTLTEEHWVVIMLVREHYQAIGAPPLMRNVCRQLGLSPLASHRLFSNCLQVWRIAGLPNPGQEAIAHIR